MITCQYLTDRTIQNNYFLKPSDYDVPMLVMSSMIFNFLRLSKEYNQTYQDNWIRDILRKFIVMNVYILFQLKEN